MKKEKRNFTLKNIELRAESNEGKKFVIGMIPYNSRSVQMFGVTEIIAPTAFNKSLADGSEIRALFNHNDNQVLGSTKSGTLKLENSETGLLCQCELPNTSFGNDCFEIINRGDVNTLSFGFVPIVWEDSENGKTRTLKEVKLIETSFCVPFPAYPETTSLTYMRGLSKRNIDIEKLNEVLEKEEILDDDKIIVKDVIDKLSSMVKEEKPVETEQLKEENKNEIISEDDKSKLSLEIECELNS
ncbi:MAG: HK97 family phage prohead protease [Methanobrevibacter sp.]|nr:HK97 family phage prohead protease [Methanobrevibacter sp.]